MKGLRGIHVHKDDIPAGLPIDGDVAIDTEAMGLMPWRDRLCLIQLSWGNGVCHLVQVAQTPKPAPRLKALLEDPKIEKIFHFARFDVAILYRTFGALANPIFCTKIASRLCRTFSDHHGLKHLCRELLGADISKSEQTSDWGAPELTDAQKTYASGDVLYLHALREKMIKLLTREKRYELFQAAAAFLPQRVLLDCAGFADDVFSY